MPSNRLQTTLMKPLVALAVPAMYLVYKYNQIKRHHQESSKRKVTEKELLSLNHKIDKLLAKLDEHDSEGKFSDEDECVVCLSAKATMQTFPCGHKVVCRKCFVKTIQVAVAQRCLPLKCVVCRTRILKLKQSGEDAFTPPTSRRGQGSSSPRPSSGSRLLAKLFSGSKSSQHSQQQQQQQQAQASAGAASRVSNTVLESSSASASPCGSRRLHTSDRQLHPGGSSQRHSQQTVVATKLMQPWLIYPSENSPKQQRAFLSDVYSEDTAVTRGGHFSPSRSLGASKDKKPVFRSEGPFSPAQRRPKHHCSPSASTRIAEIKHAHMLSPRVPRCSQCIEQQRGVAVGRGGSSK